MKPSFPGSSEEQPQTLRFPETRLDQPEGSANSPEGKVSAQESSSPSATLDDSGLPSARSLSTEYPSVAPAETDQPPLSRPLSGPSIPGYEILGELGRGGMGVVYRARQTALKRVVALKMILGGHADGEGLLRFRGEAESVAQLAHPNIVQVYEVGEHLGQPYFSLEFVAGGPLDRWLKGVPQPPRDSASLVRILALAMQAAHEKHIIHRDLKPANVLLADVLATSERAVSGGGPSSKAAAGKGESSPSLAALTPKITDFGLAKKLTEETGQTMTGAVMGTPSYMAPEQAEGRIAEIAPWTDVWALGAILYECLTGRPPFKGTTAWDTVEQVRSQEPVAPSRLAPKIPRDLETICLKCLRKTPARRYVAAVDLADDLQRFLDGRPIAARPVSACERGLKWARRRPAQAALVGALLLVVLAGAAGALFYGLYQEQQATVFRQRLERQQRVEDDWAQGQACETAGDYSRAKQHYDQALGTLDDAVSAAAELRQRLVEGSERVRRKQEERDALQKQAVELAAQREDFQKRGERFGGHRDQVLFHAVSFHDQDAANDTAVVQSEAPAALAELGLSTKKRAEDFGEGLKQWRGLFKEKDPKQLDRLASECYEVLLVWADMETAKSPEMALCLLDRAAALGKVHGLAAPRAFHLRRGRVLERLGEKDGARAEEKLAAAIPLRSALDHFQAGLESYRKGQLEQAAASCEEVLGQEGDHFWAQYLKALCNARAKPPRWREAKVGLATCVARRPDSPSLLLLLGAAHGELGDALAKKGEVAAAAKEFAAAEGVFRRALDKAETPPLRAAVLTSRGVVRIRQGRWDEACEDLLEAIKLQPQAYQGYVNLALAYQGRGDPDEAVKALDCAIPLRRDAALYNMRAQLQKKRHPELARSDFEQIIALEPAGTRSLLRAGACVELALLKYEAREYDAALADCEAALAVMPDYAEAHRQRARTLVAQGKYDQAGKALDHYLAGRTRAPVFYQARGLIHFRRGEYAQAIDACTRAILLKPDAVALRYRGWSYLALESPRLALPDFQAALRLEKKNTDALCGRGLAAVQVIRPKAKPEAVARDVRAATADADEALRLTRQPTIRLLLSCARVHARAAGVLEAAGEPALGRTTYRYQERALQLLRNALEQVPQTERAVFWRVNIRSDPALQPLRNNSGLLRLAQVYAR